MSVIDDYIDEANKAVKSGDSSRIDSLASEIVSAFHSEIPNIAYYRGQQSSFSGSSSLQSSADLRKLIGKLRVLREKRDNNLYGSYGLESFTDSIRQLEDALSNGLEGEEREELYRRIDYIFANTLHAYTSGLCGWMNSPGKTPSDEQTRLRIEKLRYYRDEELRKIRLAELQAGNVYMTQNNSQSQSIDVDIDIRAAFENVDKLPEGSLSDEDKTLLKGMLGDLDTKDDKRHKDKLHKLLNWLSDKGADVFIAAMPYIFEVIKKHMGM